LSTPRFRIVGALLFTAIVWTSPVTAQPPANGLIPGIAPYAPKAPPAKAGDTSGNQSPAPTQAPVTTGAAGMAQPDAGKLGDSYDYVLGAGDKLRIIVFGEDNLTGEFVVAGNGGISFPLIGEIHAAGRTLADLRSDIERSLRGDYLKDPRVSAEVLTFRPYYILGEVAKPGEYPYRSRITVMNAIATAGGFTYRANHKYIFVKKANETTEHKVPLTDETQIGPGDTARVSERYF
jgi:protein involved in polysaccharide export with SLBB domain